MFADMKKNCHKQQCMSLMLYKAWQKLPPHWKVVQIVNIQIVSKFFRTTMKHILACAFVHAVGWLHV